MNDAPRSIVEQAIGETVDAMYMVLRKRSLDEANSFFAGALLANIMLADPLLHEAAEAILTSSDQENPRGFAIRTEIHARIAALMQSDVTEEPHG